MADLKVVKVVSGLTKAAKEINNDNKAKGFYDREFNIGERLMQVVGELGEALESDRKGFHYKENLDDTNPSEYNFMKMVKDSMEDELADAIIRLLDMVGYMNINIDAHINYKLAFNKTRESKHGKNY